MNIQHAPLWINGRKCPWTDRRTTYAGKVSHSRGVNEGCLRVRYPNGIITLYDALISAMQWYIAFPERRRALQIKEGTDIKEDKNIFDLLNRSGVIDGSFDYEAFNELIKRALKQEMPDYDYSEILKGIESVMTQLGGMPFDENELPPEDSLTF